MLCYVMFCYVLLCYVMLCYVMLCYVMLCYVMLCYVMLYNIIIYSMSVFIICFMFEIKTNKLVTVPRIRAHRTLWKAATARINNFLEVAMVLRFNLLRASLWKRNAQLCGDLQIRPTALTCRPDLQVS